MKTANVWVFIAVTCGLTYGRTLAHAQPASDPLVVEGDDKPWNRGGSPADRQAARGLFLEGNRLFKIPLITQAIEQYTAALSKLKHPAIYFNLALAQISLGQEVEAHNNLEQALKYGEEPLGSKQFQEAQEQLQVLERKLGQIRVSCQTDGADVMLDGMPLFIGPGRYEGWVKAKAHEVTAHKSDYLSETRQMTIYPGKLKSLDLKLITLGEAAEAGRRWVTWKPWAVVAAGVVVAASAGGIHELSARNFSRFDSRFQMLSCINRDMPGCTEAEIGSDLNAKLSHARLEKNIAIGGYIVGGSAIAAGAVLLYLNRPRLLEQEPKNLPGTNVVVVPAVSSSMFGILVTASH